MPGDGEEARGQVVSAACRSRARTERGPADPGDALQPGGELGHQEHGDGGSPGPSRLITLSIRAPRGGTGASQRLVLRLAVIILVIPPQIMSPQIKALPCGLARLRVARHDGGQNLAKVEAEEPAETAAESQGRVVMTRQLLK